MHRVLTSSYGNVRKYFNIDCYDYVTLANSTEITELCYPEHQCYSYHLMIPLIVLSGNIHKLRILKVNKK